MESHIEYRLVPGIAGYRVGSDGTVWTCKTRTGIPEGGTRVVLSGKWKPKKLGMTAAGYHQLKLWDGGRQIHKFVHRLILEAFVGPCPDGMEACHCDGNRLNNALENLRWDTRKNNHADKIIHGTWQGGSRNGFSRLNEPDVVKIRERLKAGETSVSIAKDFGVTPANIRLIKNGRAWKHVS